ncbi:MAG: formate dehydrogenase accessory sulfurtransferase FdhD [Comamonadaceae bacterium]|nr:MAG: formate dehydrogenase accessory sulfurtransferase FdhD [Comamonadaceae bacterium]
MSDLTDVELPAAGACRSVAVHTLRRGVWSDVSDSVAEEVPVALEFNGISHAVMMATPSDLEDFAVGFSLSEGIVSSAAQIYDMEVTRVGEGAGAGFTIHLDIASELFLLLKERRRNLTGRTGCGICGTESLDQAVRCPAPLSGNQVFQAASIARAIAQMRERQQLGSVTGSTHAAMWADAAGDIRHSREDVGRHNALDKLVGALARAKVAAHAGFIVVTSRASYEMVQKTASCGVRLLAAVSGVTGLAVDVAEQSGVALAGFARGADMTLYTHAELVGTEHINLETGP